MVRTSNALPYVKKPILNNNEVVASREREIIEKEKELESLMEDIETKRRERSLKFREPFVPMTLGL